jgi:bacterioferritin-associated ferredoxin
MVNMKPQDILTSDKPNARVDFQVCFKTRIEDQSVKDSARSLRTSPPSSLRRLSGGSFEAQCGKCLRRSLPVDAVGFEHAWNELVKDGWTLYTSVVGRIVGMSCLACLNAPAPSPPGRP